LALVVFGALFVVLFAGYAIAQGIGKPSVPSGAVALITNVPSDAGTITEAEFKRALLQQVAAGKSAGKFKKAPKPGEKKYEELKTATLGELIESTWILAEAEEMGFTATNKEIATELAQIKKTNFKTAAAYQEFLKTSHFTQADVNRRVKLQVLETKIQETIAQKAPPPSEAEIASYYETSKATQYTTKASRDVRIVVNKDKAKVEAAQKLLEKDDSAASWKTVASKYSEDPTTKSKGGLQPGLSEELLQGKEPLTAAIFKSPTGKVVGPVDFEKNFFVIEVEKLNPEKVQPLDEVKAQIKSQLTQTVAQKVFTEFVSGFHSKWESRTYCASGFVIERCSNFVGSGHPSTAPAACYEANPKGGTPKECPAPVTQPKPALPGSVTLLKPEGEQLAQRPQPEGLKEASAESAALPEGVTPEAAAAAAAAGAE
jgi:parvulin-like peptidyl-prolyl isomerase